MKKIAIFIHNIILFSLWILINASLYTELKFIEKLIISITSLILIIVYEFIIKEQQK